MFERVRAKFGEDEAALSQGVFDTYTETNLRYSQVAPLDMYSEVNTKTNLPAQVQLCANRQPPTAFPFRRSPPCAAP